MVKQVKSSLVEEVEKATVSFWYVKEGSEIKKSESLVELVTEKTSFTFESPFSGKITKILVEEGKEISNNQVIAEIETND
jgi:2-oxoisovalerate dehydrogenase E2 component (dihydrolipoyl transacylase)